MVLWSLGKSSLSMPHFRAADYFAVHILSREQEELSGRFAKRGADKFAGLTPARGPDGIPLLDDCSARFVCRTAYQYEGGDHIIFVGEVVDFDHWHRAPLLFHKGQYGQLAKAADDTPVETGGRYADASLSYLLRLASHALLQPLKNELTSRQMEISQYYLLALLAKIGPTKQQEVLAMMTSGDVFPSDEDIEQLLSRGLLEKVDATLSLSPEGKHLHMELAAFYKATESTALEELDYDTRQVLNLALTKVIDGAG